MKAYIKYTSEKRQCAYNCGKLIFNKVLLSIHTWWWE